MSENVKDEKDLERAIEAQAKAQSSAASAEKANDSKSEALDTRTNKSAL
jgi:hypothetical protein